MAKIQFRYDRLDVELNRGTDNAVRLLIVLDAVDPAHEDRSRAPLNRPMD